MYFLPRASLPSASFTLFSRVCACKRPVFMLRRKSRYTSLLSPLLFHRVMKFYVFRNRLRGWLVLISNTFSAIVLSIRRSFPFSAYKRGSGKCERLQKRRQALLSLTSLAFVSESDVSGSIGCLELATAPTNLRFRNVEVFRERRSAALFSCILRISVDQTNPRKEFRRIDRT